MRQSPGTEVEESRLSGDTASLRVPSATVTMRRNEAKPQDLAVRCALVCDYRGLAMVGKAEKS